MAPTPLARAGGAYGYSVAASTTDFFTAGTGADVWLSVNTAIDVVTFSGFGRAVRGVGGFFFGTDLAGSLRPAATVTLRATDATGTATRTLVDPGTATFLGFVSAGAIASLTFEVDPATQDPVDPTFPTVNDFVLAAAPAVVPEPGPLALVAVGVAGVAAATAHRRRA